MKTEKDFEQRVSFTTINDQDYQKVLQAQVEFPYTSKEIFESLELTQTWIDISDLLYIQSTESKMSMGARYLAKAADEEAADYEITEMTAQKVIKGCLIDENKKKNIFFEKMEYKFELKEHPTNNDSTIVTYLFRYTPKGNIVWQYFSTHSKSLDNLVKQVMIRSLHLLERKLANPDSFNIKNEITASVKSLEKSALPKSFEHGLEGQISMSVKVEQVRAFLKDFGNYSKLHKRFEYNPEYSIDAKNKKSLGIIKFNNQLDYVMLDHIENDSENKIILTAQSGMMLIIGDFRIQFELSERADQNGCTCKMSVFYCYKTVAKFLGLDKASDEKAHLIIKKLIATCLRHIDEAVANKNQNKNPSKQESKLEEESNDLEETENKEPIAYNS